MARPRYKVRPSIERLRRGFANTDWKKAEPAINGLSPAEQHRLLRYATSRKSGEPSPVQVILAAGDCKPHAARAMAKHGSLAGRAILAAEDSGPMVAHDIKWHGPIVARAILAAGKSKPTVARILNGSRYTTALANLMLLAGKRAPALIRYYSRNSAFLGSIEREHYEFKAMEDHFFGSDS